MKRLIPVFILFSFVACSQKKKANLLVFNARIYTVDSSFTVAEAMVIDDGKLLDIGKTSELEKKYDPKEKLDAAGKFIYPGFIDAHTHFVSYGLSLQRVNLDGTTSWDDVVERTKAFATKKPEGWLLGRGWDQNDWPLEVFPDNEKLNQLFPDRPVLLTRVDGHAAIANQKALDLAGVKAGDTISGGEIEVKKGKLTGILIDNATRLVSSKVPATSPLLLKEALLDAQKNCFGMGLTTVDECGLSYETIEFIDSLQKKGELRMRVYAMLSDDKKNIDFANEKGIIKTGSLSVRALKIYADGALGSRGACLLQPYDDRAGWSGFLLSSRQHFDSIASWGLQKGFQICAHAIGDSGNRTILNIYAGYLKGKNDRRWRIEHAQVINENDFKLFGEYNIIPSVQPTHATSDMYWAGVRLGKERVKGAYAYRQLMEENGWIPLGTDFPVEDISTFKTFYAASQRKDAKGWPEGGYQPENKLSREATLRGMTIWAAKANFEENEKGSLEKGKLADFVILDADLMKENPEKLLTIKVLKTYLGGQKVYEVR